MKRTLILAFLCCLCGTTLLAQTTISGRVVSADNGQPLSFATIIVKSTGTATQTDDDGKYVISVPGPNQILVFSYIGYMTQEINAGTRSIIDAALPADAIALDEVLVTAFGTSTRKTFTGSASQVSGDILVNRPVMNAAQALAGVTSGVQVAAATGQPGSSPTIRIRGISSINSGNDPLYVVDGAPYGGALNDIPSEDIASITVLKDASSSALYGSRAANGVIMITTKRGRSGDKTRVSVNVKQGVVLRALPEQSTLSPGDWYELMWETYRNGLMTTGVSKEVASQRASSAPKNASGLYTDGVISKTLYNPYNVPADQIVGTDGRLNSSARLLWADDLNWFDALERTGNRGEYTISVSGGSEKSGYYASASYSNEQGYVMKTDYNRITARAGADFKPRDWIKGGIMVNGARRQSNYSGSINDAGSGYANAFYFARNIGPIYPIYVHDQTSGAYLYDSNGDKYWDWGGRTDLGSPTRPYSAGRHIVAEMLYNSESRKDMSLGGNAYLEISPIKGLTIRATSSTNLIGNLFSSYDNKIVGDGAPAGRANRTNYFYTTWNNNQIITYTNSLGKHDFTILAGHESYSYEYNYLYAMRQAQVMDGNDELVNFTTTNSLTSYTNTQTTEGYLSDLKYSYDNKYLLGASFRRDGSSRFHKNNRWGNFWSVSAGWRIESEAFMQNATWLDLLKLRASYGTVGNDDVGYYPYMALYSLSSTANAGEAGTYQTNLPNYNLKWEVINSFDAAIEFGLWRRLSGSVEFFRRETSDMLLNRPLPLSSGAAGITETSATTLQNIGVMYNQGLEVQLEWDAFKGKDFGWKLAANATLLKNRITSLPEESRETGVISGTKKWMEGHSLMSFWLREWMGVDPQDGYPLYRLDTEKTPYSSTDATHRIHGRDTLTTNVNNARYKFAGDAFPTVYGSIGSNLRYKRLSLDFMFTWSIGGKIYDGTYANFMSVDASYGYQKHADMKKRWQNPGDITGVPRADDQMTTNLNAGTSTRWLTNSSYLNLQTVTLSYRIPTVIKGTRFLENALIYLTADNLFQISARKGMNAAQNMSGTTSNVYSPSRSIVLGLNINL